MEDCALLFLDNQSSSEIKRRKMMRPIWVKIAGQRTLRGKDKMGLIFFFAWVNRIDKRHKLRRKAIDDWKSK